jgi:TetR/AcrR family transcriptional regulator, transcriptional repressor for nem operon
VRVSKEKAAENRAALLQAASRLFRSRGIDGVGVADIAKEAGLTHGALYAHFPSKEALAAEAFSHGFAGSMAGVDAWADGQRRSFGDYLGRLLSPAARANLESGCPLAASASEIGRQGGAVSATFTEAFDHMVAMFDATMPETIPAAQRRKLAITAVIAEIGALAVSRAVEKTDAALADEVLDAVRTTITAASASAG